MEVKNIDNIKEFSESGFLRKRIWETENLHCNIYTFEPGGLNQVHCHPNTDEVVLCIEGESEIVVGDKRKPIKAKRYCSGYR